MTLGEVLEKIRSFDEESLIFAERDPDWSSRSRAEVIPIPADPHDNPEPLGLEYFIEVYQAIEVLEAWSSHRDGHQPTVLEMIEAIAYYQEHDSWLLPNDVA